ncbi:2-keto-4-pentenoate hydratase [Rhodopila sp.]|uniref:2-keto-4-pentenoate hydratase n=1 Tax=Rhodopila sp. TaxID=2480087 RepID=UPI003D0A946E
MAFNPAQAAAALLRDRQNHMVVSSLPPGIAPTTEAEGAAVQHALARLVNADPPFGFKIGATGRRMQTYLGVDAPIAGFMQGKDVYLSHANLRFADYIRPGVECEVAVRLAADLPPGPCSLQQAQAAVGDFVAAIEIVENRYGDLKDLGTPTLVADQMYHAAAVIGEQGNTDWRTLDIGALHGRISLDDGTGDHGVTTDLLGHPLTGLAWLAGSAVAAAFGGLKAGQIVMLGSVTPPVWLSGPATVTVTFPPLPPVTVRLT